jgi:polyhydroxybutyrate depolymerase
MPGWVDRSFDIELPASWDGTSPLPVILALHGGGGNKRAAAVVSCPTGTEGEPGCLPEVAKARGFAVVRPDGTGTRPLRNIRTWNSGGGVDGWNCASGGACKAGIDDVAYFRGLLDEVAKTVPVDAARVFATGLSNGGSMSHRLACELPDRIAAIVAIGGGNQFAAAGGACTAAVPVLHIHGTEDPCWSYTTSDTTCLGEGDRKVGVAESVEGWRLRNGCNGVTTEEKLPDRDPGDGTTSVRIRHEGCAADVEHIRVDGGGHTWPNGYQYFDVSRIGRVGRDFGSEVVVEFFLAHPKK